MVEDSKVEVEVLRIKYLAQVFPVGRESTTLLSKFGLPIHNDELGRPEILRRCACLIRHLTKEKRGRKVQDTRHVHSVEETLYQARDMELDQPPMRRKLFLYRGV